VVAKVKLFGEKTGIAFQIKDDLLDFSTNDTGKPRGIDLKDKKMTLPVIFLLRQSSSSEKRKIIHIIRNHHDDNSMVKKVMEWVKTSGGLDYAARRMNEYKNEALNILYSFPESSSRKALEKLVMFTTERIK
jgi:octaprenyl-diphosphate synthase